MNAKEKAKELIKKYSEIEIQIGGQYDGYLSMQIHDAKECALILVEEMIKEHTWKNSTTFEKAQLKKWEDVKSELQSL
jgi:hypothetical protein